MPSPAFALVAGVLLCVAGTAGAEDKKPEVRAKLEGHRGSATSVAFSKTGDLIATGAGNGDVRIWDAKTGKQLAKLDEHKGESITSVAFSADGKLLCASAQSGFVVWDVTTTDKSTVAFKELIEAEHGYLGAISGDGKHFYFVQGGKSGGAALFQLWQYDVAKKSTKILDNSFAGKVRAICAIMDEESRTVAVVGHSEAEKQGYVKIYGTGKTIELSTDEDRDERISFSPDGKWLCTSGSDGLLKLWKVPGSQIVEGKPLKMEFRADMVALGTNNTFAYSTPPNPGKKVSIKLLKIAAKPELIATFATDINEVSCLAFSPDGKTLAVGEKTEGIVELWTITSEKK